jgi:hypothetical protein
MLSLTCSLLLALQAAVPQSDRQPLDRFTPVSATPGRFLASGYFTAGYDDTAESPSSFYAALNPVFVWHPSAEFLAEAEVEFTAGGEGEEGHGNVELEYAQAAWQACDWVTIGAGLFLSPLGLFSERYHPTWINRLPTDPLIAGHGGFVPFNLLGAQARGQWQTGEDAAVTWVVFAANGPDLNNGLDEEEEAGFLHFDPEQDDSQSKAFGGRIAWVPCSWAEVGINGMNADVDGGGTSEANLTAQIVGLDAALRWNAGNAGVLRADFEWFQSTVGDTTYLPATPAAVTFDNQRSGGYLLLAFRPAAGDVLDQLEGVVRLDWLDLPEGAPEDADVDRVTAGLDWWFDASKVIKVAVDNVDVDGESSSNFYIQFAMLL